MAPARSPGTLMKKLPLIFCALFLISCTSSHQTVSISREQAAALAMRLANDKAFAAYHCRPFRNTQSVRFVGDHWTWSDREGYGHGDIEAKVELASDGSARKVEIDLLDSRALLDKQF